MSRLEDVQPVNFKISINPFILGIARLFDFAQVLNLPGSKSAVDIDKIALHDDWVAIGNDMRKAIDKYKVEFSHGQ